MQSPLFLANEDIEEVGNVQVMDQAVKTLTINDEENSKNGQSSVDEESDAAILEERTRQLLIELQQKRNDESTKASTSNVVEGWLEREENAKLRAETAENRAQCAMGAAAKLAEENDRLNRKILESRASLKALKYEKDLALSQARSLLIKSTAEEQKMNEILAERASAEAFKKVIGEKIKMVKGTMDNINRWIAETEEISQVLREEIEAFKPLKTKTMEMLIQGQARTGYLIQRINELTKTTTELIAENGALKARLQPISKM